VYLSTPQASKAHRHSVPLEARGRAVGRRWRAIVRGLIVPLVAMPAVVAAQDAVTVTGHVSTGNMPLQGATVAISSLDVSALTDENGRYSFIVPSSRVRGQRVTIAARRARYTTQSFEITLLGGSMVQDFNLPPNGSGTAAPRGAEPPVAVATAASSSPRQASMVVVPASSRRIVDSTAFGEAAGPLDLPSALAGRAAGVIATTSSTLGGSNSILVRGSRSLLGNTQPLYVVDGTPIDNSTVSTTPQRFGFGGFDYGSAVQDLNLGDIALVQILVGPEAAMLYGGRGANGVVLINTKTGRGLNTLDISASQQVTFESALKLPTYQNSYGQGLAGKFAFFDGAGGGLNDGVAENWGPVIQGQPIAQASLFEAKRGDVRPWVTHPDNFSGYLEGARSLTTNVALQGSNDRASFHASANNRDFTGLTPGSSVARRGGSLTASVQPTALFTATANLQYFNDDASHRPGSGYDESNPVSGFARLGRQVDVQALRDHLRDATDNPISWNYAGHNNPYFEPLLNSNFDHRERWLGGLGGTYALSASITANGHVGTDSYDATRRFRVAPGWMSGYPFFTGRSDFPQSGRENQAVSVGEKNAEFSVHVSPGGSASRVVVSAGVTWRSNSLTSLDSVVTDTTLNGNASAPKATAANQFSSSTTNKSVFGAAELRFQDYGKLTVAARNEWASVFPAGHDAQLYPSVIGTLDLKRAVSSLRDNGSVSGARLRAGISRAGNDLAAYTLQNLYTGNQSSNNVSLAPSLKLGTSTTLEPEATTAFELGGDIQLFRNRLGLDLTVYNENTSNLILAVASQGTATPTNAGSLSNKGIEAAITLTPLLVPDGLQWDVAANFARNSSAVESLNGSAQSIPLAPSRWGVGLEARKGQPIGVLVGNGFLRDQSGRLILRQGKPLPDTVAGPRVLGATAPSWTGGLANTVRFRWVELSALLTARMGGHVFSASNYWGATSGSLEETSFRPDTGMLIAGVDAATGNANTQHVTTEDYYHALRAIPERWVYDGNVIKLREARLSVTLPLRIVPGFRTQSIRTSFIGRNLLMWTKAPNIDPETAVSVWGFQGFELGQLPTTRSVGFQITVTP